jgi:hypothetical protein
MLPIVGAISILQTRVVYRLPESMGQLVLDGRFHFMDVAVMVSLVLKIKVVFRTLYSHLVIFIEPLDNSATVS